MSFTTEQVQLSMYSPDTGLPLTANVYTLDGVTEVDGSPRKMSIGQLVMALCLQRASALEDEIIGVMNEINANTALLEGLTTVENSLVAVNVGGTFDSKATFSYQDTTIQYYIFLRDTVGVKDLPSSGSWNYDTVQSVISKVEDAMDSLNTISQDTLIKLQSLTAKRDQTYDLVSNVLKSLNNVLVGNANNL